jgi:opacity protein-like surface antigen
MRKYLLAAVAAAAIASPAAARDGSVYVGADLGAMMPVDNNFDIETPTDSFSNAMNLDYDVGYDIDINGGYDFGMFRAEAELGYKRASANEVTFSTLVDPAIGPYDADGKGSVLSLMVNGLLDFDGGDGWGGFVGAGVGVAKVKVDTTFTGAATGLNEFSIDDSDSGFAWQAVAGVHFAVSQNIDLGVKYRFFHVPNVTLRDSTAGVSLEDHWRSHSILARLTYNFYTPPAPVEAAPPPPPPPPPATQTCPDGSVILATEACPAPPAPPPPPPPAPERG